MFVVTCLPNDFHCSYKSGQVPAFVITNSGNNYYKLGQNNYKSEQLLQVKADLLQICAAITNWGKYYKLVHSSV